MMINKPYEIDETKYQRFDEKNHMIFRSMWDKSLPTYRQMFFTNIEKHIKSIKEGYTRFDFAFVKAACLFSKVEKELSANEFWFNK